MLCPCTPTVQAAMLKYIMQAWSTVATLRKPNWKNAMQPSLKCMHVNRKIVSSTEIEQRMKKDENMYLPKNILDIKTIKTECHSAEVLLLMHVFHYILITIQ